MVKFTIENKNGGKKMTDINNMEMVCCFYASEWHLTAMLVPNIDREINRGIKITTILEKNLENNMETLLKKLNLLNKKEILNIGWNRNELDLNEIKKKIENNECIIIVGTVEYIKKAHSLIEKCINKDRNIKIIDCYDINECEREIRPIINEHEKILNTLGEKDKEEYITEIKVAN